MSKKRLRISHKSAVKKVDEDFGGNISKAARELGIPKTTLYRWYKDPSRVVKRFIVTYAQNNTHVHEGFFKALQHYISEWDSELICYKGTYRNPTSKEERMKYMATSWYDKRILPYLMDTNRDLNDNLMIYSARTQPTAVNPLSGYDTHTGHMSGIFPHPKIRLRTVATPGNKMPKLLTTTGAITKRNYSKSKAGEKGQHHHIIGAVVVEVVDEKKFHIRHINASSDGSFFDIAGGMCWKYTPNGIEKKHEIDEYVMGDIHYPFVDKKALMGGFDLMERLNPKRVYIHDLIDFWARNHHERANRFLNVAKEQGGLIDVQQEIIGAAELLRNIANPKKREVKVVKANHDDAIDRWLQEEQIDRLGKNTEYFHWLSYNKHRSVKSVIWGFEFFNTLEFAVKEHLDIEKNKVVFLKRTDHEVHNNIDYGMHGDVGPNGARGSAINLSKIGTKTVIGHTHSPSIVDGCYQVGVKSLIPLGYAKDGPSSWMHTDCITYPNGKRTLINFIEGEYYLKD